MKIYKRSGAKWEVVTLEEAMTMLHPIEAFVDEVIIARGDNVVVRAANDNTRPEIRFIFDGIDPSSPISKGEWI